MSFQLKTTQQTIKQSESFDVSLCCWRMIVKVGLVCPLLEKPLRYTVKQKKGQQLGQK